MKKKVVIYGASITGKIAYLNFVSKYDILFFIDNNKKNIGDMLFDIPIYTLEEAQSFLKVEYKILISTGGFNNEIRELLESKGFYNLSMVQYDVNLDIDLNKKEKLKIRKLKNIHKNKRCFIIGNGPSLRNMNLHCLKDEYTFTSNMFHLHHNIDLISPSFYCISDWMHWKNGYFIKSMKKQFPSMKSTQFFFEYESRSAYYSSFINDKLNVNFIKLNENKPVYEGNFATDAEDELYWSRSVTSDFSIPLAIYMGFKEIYLIGCDYNWHIEKSKDLEKGWFYNIEEDDRDVFPSKAHREAGGQPGHIKLALKSLEVIKKYADDNNISIKNAGIGGRVDMFERVDFNELF